MYKIEKTEYGLKLVLEGFIQADEMREYVEECRKQTESMPEQFKIMLDMRKMKTLPPDAKKILEEGQRHSLEHGLMGTAIIASNVVTKEQQRNIGAKSGVGEGEVYIDGSEPDWEEKALNWLLHGISPE